MSLDTTFITVLAIILLSSLVRATLGFGNSLIAMPLLAMTPIGMRTATPLIALIAALHALMIIIKDWRIIDLKNTWRLLIGTLPGIPLGLLLLTGAYEQTVKVLLAFIIMGFSVYSLAGPREFVLRREWTAYPFGFIAGILGGAYNTNGPPIVIYGTARQWSPDRFRANLQGYFFPSNLIIISSHAVSGLWTPAVGRYVVASLPIVALSAWIGNRLNGVIPPRRFERLIHILLVLIASLLLIQTVFA